MKLFKIRFRDFQDFSFFQNLYFFVQVFNPETFIRAKSGDDDIKEDESLNTSADKESMNISVEDALAQLDMIESQVLSRFFYSDKKVLLTS